MPSTPAVHAGRGRDRAARSGPVKSASIVIHARNAAENVRRLIESLRNQTVKPDEIVFVDAGSSDSTVTRARRHDVRVFSLGSEEGTHGSAINLGARKAESPVVVLLSAHALPRSREWLESLLAPFHDERVAAVFGGQVPREDCNPLDALEIRRRFGARPRRYALNPPFSHTNAAVRRRLVLSHPFPEHTTRVEDRIWGAEICEAGWTVAYVPRAAVIHSQNDTLREVFLRRRQEIHELTRYLGLDTPLSDWWMLPFAWSLAVGRDALRLLAGRHHLRWLFRAPAYRMVHVLGTWNGHRDALKE